MPPPSRCPCGTRNLMPVIRPTAGFPALVLRRDGVCRETILMKLVVQRLPRQT